MQINNPNPNPAPTPTPTPELTPWEAFYILGRIANHSMVECWEVCNNCIEPHEMPTDQAGFLAFDRAMIVTALSAASALQVQRADLN